MVIRPYRDADARGVADMLGESAALDASIAAVTEDAWRAFTRRSFNRGARDFVVVEEERRVVALLTSTLLDAKHALVR